MAYRYVEGFADLSARDKSEFLNRLKAVKDSKSFEAALSYTVGEGSTLTASEWKQSMSKSVSALYGKRILKELRKKL